MTANKTPQKLANPFDVEDKEKVWKDLLKNSKPISKAEALRKMKEASEAQKKLNQS
jgi:hypothetical protein